MKLISRTGYALLVAALPLRAETTPVAELPSDTAATFPTALIVGLILVLAAMGLVTLLRRKLNRLDWD